MNNLKQNAIGIDAMISRIQKRVYDELIKPENWGDNLTGFSRCVMLEGKKGKNLVAHYYGKKEYEDVVYAERSKFFFVSRREQEKVDNLNYETTIELFFIVDLSVIKPNLAHRGDIEAEADVERILNEFDNVWIERLMSGYKLAMNSIYYQQDDDMQPYHVFKYELGIRYNMNDECNCDC